MVSETTQGQARRAERARLAEVFGHASDAGASLAALGRELVELEPPPLDLHAYQQLAAGAVRLLRNAVIREQMRRKAAADTRAGAGS